jgi:hypothetical protein
MRSVDVAAITVAANAAAMGGALRATCRFGLSTLSSEHLCQIGNRAAHLVAFQIEECIDQANPRTTEHI